MALSDQFRFKKHDRVGEAAAEQDGHFLEECFVETEDLEALKDCIKPYSIVVGRVGSGKTALLQHIVATEERVIEIQPENLALNFISNSTILTFLDTLGVKLDIFFKLLWRHVFTVEIIKDYFDIKDEESKVSLLTKFTHRLYTKQSTQAIRYIEKWGSSFWEETEKRIKETTTKIESELNGALKVTTPPISFKLEDIEKLTKEQKEEIHNRVKHVINKVQMRQLTETVEMVNEILSDPQKKYYIIIDRLDEDWAENKIRYKLIRALFETVRDFRKVKHAKILIAIRSDLLDRVFRFTAEAGFQREKYESLFLRLKWDKKCLIDILDERINFLVKRAYTRGEVSHKDILPKTINKKLTIDYILARTFMRPRDIIMFINCCIGNATNRPKMIVQTVRDGEGEYSETRLKSLEDEWSDDFPYLNYFVNILKYRNPNFKIIEINEDAINTLCLEFAVRSPVKKGILSSAALGVVNCTLNAFQFKQLLFYYFFTFGLVKIKLNPHEKFVGPFNGSYIITPMNIEEKTIIAIHPMFWRALGIKE